MNCMEINSKIWFFFTSTEIVNNKNWLFLYAYIYGREGVALHEIVRRG